MSDAAIGSGGADVAVDEGKVSGGGGGGGVPPSDLEGTVSMRFVIGTSGLEHVIPFPLDTQFGAVKAQLAADLRIPESHLALKYKAILVPPETALADLGLRPAQPGVTVDVEVDERHSGGEYKMPDVLKVVVRDDDGNPLGEVDVAIVREEARKPYLGGFRNKKTGLIYHHAATQTPTDKKRKYDGAEPKISRETQTRVVVTRSVQTMRECGTQMARPDLYIDTSGDRVMYPRKYFTADAMHMLKTAKTLVIQCHWRGYCARKRAWDIREQMAKAREDAMREEEVKRVETEKKHHEELERRMHPRTAEDFEILYNELEAWRTAETKRINGLGLEERERLEELAQLLQKETKLLQTIDRLKITAAKENKDKRVTGMLEEMSKPQQWEMSDGEVAKVHTPFSTRAKELMDLYNGLGLKGLTTEERFDVLLHVKWTVKEFDCKLTREIVELIDREADMLNRGRPEKSLEGLRKRISNLFLHFVETPEFNPEAARFIKVPTDIAARPLVKPI